MHASLSQQFEIPSTLISRFDLIYALSDTPEAQKDSAIADYILNTHMTQEVKTGLPNEVLRKYIAYARTINPKLTKEAVLVIKEYYTKVRGLANNMEAVPITARSLEALVRLCEAAARSRLSETITVDDAGVVVTLVDTCMRKIAYDAASNTWDVDKIINKYPKRSRDIVARINDAIIVLGGVEGIASQNDVAAHLKRMYGTNEEDTLNHIEMLYNERRVMYPRNGYVRLVK